MPFTNGEKISYGSGSMPVYWCSYGCNRGHTDQSRIIEHEEALIEHPQIKELAPALAGHYRFECALCHFKGEQPFDIAIHKCPLSAFKCSKRAPEPRKERKLRQLSASSTDSGYSNAAAIVAA